MVNDKDLMIEKYTDVIKNVGFIIQKLKVIILLNYTIVDIIKEGYSGDMVEGFEGLIKIELDSIDYDVKEVKEFYN